MAVADLVALLAVRPPDLPDAACVAVRGLFDAVVDEARTSEALAAQCEAVETCQRCPELGRCAEWLESLPPCRRPRGVVVTRTGRVRPPVE